MTFLRRLTSIASWILRRDLAEQRLTDEIHSFVEMSAAEKIREGVPPAEARRRALAEVGGVERMKESVRAGRHGALLDDVGRDVRYAFRLIARQRTVAAVIVGTLALGIGANTAIFSIVDAVLLKQLPVKAPEQLILLSHTGRVDDDFPYDYYELIRQPNAATSGVLAYHPLRLTVDVEGQHEPAINGQLVSGNYFEVLGINAALGRTITPQDTGETRAIGKKEAEAPSTPAVCVISDGYWQRRFARDPAIIGTTLRLSGHPFTIIGVTPPEFFGLEVGHSMDISVPLTMQQLVMPGTPLFIDQSWERLRLMGRLRPGVMMASAQANLSSIYQRYLHDSTADLDGPKGVWVRQQRLQQRLHLASGSQGLSEMRRQFSRPLFVLLCVVALVLLISCANVAGLLLARGAGRRKELAMRLTLGAGRGRLVRQLFTESLLLACLGSLLGLLLSWWGTQLLLLLLSQDEIPVYLSLTPELRMLGFTAVVTVLVSLLAGLAPALLASRVDLQTALKQDAPGHGSRRALSFGNVFVVAQVALSLPLLIGAGLFVRSLHELQQVDSGYTRESVLVLKLEPISDEKPRLTALYDELLRRVKAIPGVMQASLVGYSPISRREWLAEVNNPAMTSSNFYAEGTSAQSASERMVSWMQVYPNSFAALGIQLIAGRDIGSQDVRGAPDVAVINESMARQLFGNESPIGRRFGWVAPHECCYEIVGVVKDAKYLSLREEGRPMYYVSYAQANFRNQMTLVMRTAGDIAPIAAAIQHEARALDPQMPRFEVETLAAQVDASLTQERLIATLSSVFGLLALALVCIGLYGVLAHEVARRTREIGIRMALGASGGRVVQMVLRTTLWLVGSGVALGLGLTLAATRSVKGLLYGLEPNDPLTIGLAVLTLLLITALASFLPARRASRVDPIVALR